MIKLKGSKVEIKKNRTEQNFKGDLVQNTTEVPEVQKPSEELKVPEILVESGMRQQKEDLNEFNNVDQILLDYKIPISHESILEGHSKGVVA